MAEKPKVCMICGTEEVDGTSICPSCSDGVKREALGQHARLKQQAEKAVRRQGVNPEQTQKPTQP